jgi:hypothetical protein
MPFDPKNAEFAAGFVPTNMVVVGTKNNRGAETPVVVYQNEFKGKTYFHIRELWCDANDVWNVGKGLSLPAEGAAAVFANIGKLVTPVAAPATKPSPRKVRAG